MIKKINQFWNECDHVESVLLITMFTVITIILALLISNIITLRGQEIADEINKDKQTSIVVDDTDEKFRK